MFGSNKEGHDKHQAFFSLVVNSCGGGQGIRVLLLKT